MCIGMSTTIQMHDDFQVISTLGVDGVRHIQIRHAVFFRIESLASGNMPKVPFV